MLEIRLLNKIGSNSGFFSAQKVSSVGFPGSLHKLLKSQISAPVKIQFCLGCAVHNTHTRMSGEKRRSP